ncbi:hypothetical protein F4782DRAFT_515055 [Xylaria castorea]|nr:hypothetical protein F4782DRAFT_515055 [Xylaria castorea]
MAPHNGPDGPPPPYSETDIYSHSHGSRNHPSSGADDDVSIAPSSSNSNIIFTPPESPRDAQHSFAGPSSDQHSAASAQAYFDSRPPNRPAGPSITIVLEITPAATPSDFPYPKRALERDITEQDWQTFINYLIPEHAARANSRIIDRKLGGAGSSQPSDDIAETRPKSSANVHVSPQDIDAVTREWNHGFFEPRGVTIRPTSPAEPPVEEEAQIRGDETSRAASAEAGQGQGQPQQPGGWWRQQPGSSWWRSPFGTVDGNNGSVHIGPLHIEGDRVALGSTFEADRNGVRWGGGPTTHPLFEASSRGVRWGEQPSPGLGHPYPFDHQGGHPWAGPFGGRGRGRGREYGNGRRDHSRSSTSSSSSDSSSGSDSSVGSLPDWDDLKDTQLPVTKRSVQGWLSHPDQPVTRDMLKQAKSEIKAAKSAPPPPRDPSWDQARESLRREVKDLLQQFKLLKRQQKAVKRATRRERRQQKRAARQDRRERRRSDRHDRRGLDRATRRAERDTERHARRHRHHNPAPPVVPVSAVPPSPPGPHAFPAPPAFLGGRGGFFGRGSFGRGSFGPHPSSSSSPPGFGFGRGFGQRRGGRGRDRGWEQQAHDATEQANRAAAEARSNAERQVEEALAAAARERENALAQAGRERENALAQAGRERRKAAEVAEESRRAAAEAAQRSRAHAAAVTAAAAEETRRATTEAASRAAVDAKLAEARALESQISAKAGQIQALEANLGRDQNDDEKRKGSEKLSAIEQLEEEMDLLGRKVEALRVEADEEFARRLAQRGDEWGEWK